MSRPGRLKGSERSARHAGTPANAAAADAERFDAMFEISDDPWGFRSRWYEARKRELTLAALPQRRYRNGFEPGCANGELGLALASRCETLLLADLSPRAVALARQRVATFPNVQVKRMRVPDHWPGDHGPFDLIVVSELGYYLDSAALVQLADRIRASLSPGGTVLACHWLRPLADARVTGPRVHSTLHERLALPRVGRWLDADFRIDLWTADGRSVAEAEGLAGPPGG